VHLRESETAAQALGVEVRVVEAREPDDLVKSFEAIVKKRAEAVMVLADPMFITHRRRIVELAAENRLPSIFGERGSVQAGGLMFYGASTPGPPTGEPGAKWRVGNTAPILLGPARGSKANYLGRVPITLWGSQTMTVVPPPVTVPSSSFESSPAATSSLRTSITSSSCGLRRFSVVLIVDPPVRSAPAASL